MDPNLSGFITLFIALCKYVSEALTDRQPRHKAPNAQTNCPLYDFSFYPELPFLFSCASRVGRGGDKMQKLTIGSPALRCKVGNIIHELGHAVGFFHEHSRPDRNKYVRVLKKNILPGE